MNSNDLAALYRLNKYFNGSSLLNITKNAVPELQTFSLTVTANLFYAFSTPIVFLVGLVTNSLSLFVFSAKRLRCTSAASAPSYCLCALSLSDLLVLLTSVTTEWTQRGLPFLITHFSANDDLAKAVNLPDRPGFCWLFLFVKYVFRFTSVWILVLFTIERYIGVCRPFYKAKLCNSYRIKLVILIIFLLSICISLCKPIISNTDNDKCGTNDSQQNKRLGFYFDAIYGILLTVIPSLLIFAFNTLISQRLLLAYRKLPNLTTPCQDSQRSSQYNETPPCPYNNQTPSTSSSSHNRGRKNPGEFNKVNSPPNSISKSSSRSSSRGLNHICLQFGVTLLGISSSFLILNLPFYITWCIKAMKQPKTGIETREDFEQGKEIFGMEEESNHEYYAAILTITRSIFQINYCINFFLYSLTSAYFRFEIKRLFRCKKSNRNRSFFNLPKNRNAQTLKLNTEYIKMNRRVMVNAIGAEQNRLF